MSALQIATPSVIRSPAKRDLAGAGLTARLALDDQTRADAYSVRHASYLGGGFIDPQPGGIFTDADDQKASSRSAVVYQWGRPVASVRWCMIDQTPGLEGWDEIPASRIFPDEVAELARNVTHGRPAKIMESNRLVRHPDFEANYQLVFILYRLTSIMLMETQADMLLSCVRRNHMPFYKRMHFDYVAGPRRYPGVKFETNLMACPYDGFDKVRAEIPHVGTDPATNRYYADAGLMHGETVNVFLEG